MLELHVPDMTCGGCAKAITRALTKLDDNALVEADPPSHRLTVQTSAPVEQVMAALEKAGYPARPRG